MDQQTPPPPPNADLKTQVSGHMNALEAWMVPLFEGMPHLPPNIRTVLRDIAPWLAIIFGVLGLMAVITAGFFTMIFSPFMILSSGVFAILSFVGLLVAGVSSVLDIMAFKPLREGKKIGWNYLFYGSVLSAASSILMVVQDPRSVGTLIFTAIGFWLLFEIRSFYR